MANERDGGKGERWRQEARGKGEARRALQAKLIGQVGGNIITCNSRARCEGSPHSTRGQSALEGSRCGS